MYYLLLDICNNVFGYSQTTFDVYFKFVESYPISQMCWVGYHRHTIRIH